MPASKNNLTSEMKELLDAGKLLHKKGDLLAAAARYKRLLDLAPDNSDALYLLGLIYYRGGKQELAIRQIKLALKHNPANALAHASLAQILLDQHQYRAARKLFTTALKINPLNPNILNGLGLALMSLREFEESRRLFLEALELDNSLYEPRYNLGTLESRVGNQNLAIQYYSACLKIKPKEPEILNSLGAIYFSQHRLDKAQALFEQAIDQYSSYAEAHNNLGALFIERSQFELALQHFICALELKSSFGQAHVNAGLANHLLGRTSTAVQTVELAMRIAPEDDPLAHFARCFVELSPVYDSVEQQTLARTGYRKALQDFKNYQQKSDSRKRAKIASLIGYMQPFYLPYHDQNDCDLQRLYGECIISQVPAMAGRDPRGVQRYPSPGKQLRIGIVSAFFYDHSNWKIPIKGWLEALAIEFEVYAYHTGHKLDAVTKRAQALTKCFHHNMSFEQLKARITEDQIDVLLYPEIGMSQLTARLASCRLAPVQCVSWGHPVTSGFPTMDYFLSSELMEPEHAQQWYTEKLVRLPGLSFCWEPPGAENDHDGDRRAFGLSEQDIVFLCVQNISKYLSDFDHLLTAIAKIIPQAKFVFIQAASQHTQKRFEARIATAFAAVDLNHTRHTRFIKRLDTPGFRLLNQLADICLDTPGWSGCNSSLEAIACNLPIVTIAGKSMRSRHTAAIYQQMDHTDLIADDESHYIELACKLATDLEWRQRQRQKIAECKSRLTENPDLVKALYSFIYQAVEQSPIRS